MKHKFKNFELTLETGGKEVLDEIKRSFKSSKINDEMINEAVQNVLAQRSPNITVVNVYEPEGGYMESSKFPKIDFVITSNSYYGLLRESANFRTGLNTIKSLTFYPGIDQLNQFERQYQEFLKINVDNDWKELLFEDTGYVNILNMIKQLTLQIFKLKNLIEEYNLMNDSKFVDFIQLSEELKEDKLKTDIKYVTEVDEAINEIQFKPDRESEEQLEINKHLEKLKKMITHYKDEMITTFQRR